MKNDTLAAICAGAVLLTGAVSVLAESEPEDIIKYRKNVMTSNGAHIAAAGAIIQGKVAEFKGHLGYHVAALRAINQDVAALFPDGSDFGDTDALDGVWSKRAEFEKRAKNARVKSEAFAKAVASGDAAKYTAAFKELADACKACHKDFRKEQN